MRSTVALLGLLASILAACGPATGPASTPQASASATAPTPPPADSGTVLGVRRGAPIAVTLLFTTDEHGWLEPAEQDGKRLGGAAELLGRLVLEGHCPGAVPEGVDPQGGLVPPSPEDCKNPRTLLLSDGDNYTGPAITTYFTGEPMAGALLRLGYAASAFGNHEVDFGKDRLVELRKKANLPYLAANIKIADAKLAADLGIEPYHVFTRRGAKIAVVGLAPADAMQSSMAARWSGIELLPTEAALGKAVDDAWNAGVDAVVVAAHECPDTLVPIVEKHPEWQLAFVGGGHCHKTMDLRAAGAAVMAPPWAMRGYARVVLTINQSLDGKSHVASVEPSLVDVTDDAKAPPADPVLARHVAAWKAKVDKELGVSIGHTETGLTGPEVLGGLIARAWLAELGGDVAVMNRGGIRQPIPKGDITLATLWGVLPFDNRIVKVTVSGSDLIADLEMPKVITAGARKDASGKWVLGSGKPIDPKGKYTLLATDFMYTGGDGAKFKEQDPKGQETNVNWRDPVIAWIKKQSSSAKDPLEKKLPKEAAPKPEKPAKKG